MKRHKLPVRFTGQHFTVDQSLIAEAIVLANLEPHHTVLDIGAGKGNLTLPLARCCRRVIAIENDPHLLPVLRKRLSGMPHVTVANADFTTYTLPRHLFKVVSNIPYGLTSEILRSLMYTHAEYFGGGALVLQREPARKLFAGMRSNPYTICYHTFFDMRLVSEIPPQSFFPPPRVISALLQIEMKKKPLLEPVYREKYKDFLAYMLQRPGLTARVALLKLFRKSQLRELAGRYGIKTHRPVAQLSVSQWLSCFREMLHNVPERFHPGGVS